MGDPGTTRSSWVLEPLVRAGVDPDRAADLLFRLAFAAIVDTGADPAAVVADQSTGVRRAWAVVLGRLLLLDGLLTEAPGGGSGE